MCCIKWRKTYRKVVSNSPNQLEYLAQVTYDKGIWVEISVEAGPNLENSGAAATWIVPIRVDLVTGGNWRIVAPHTETPAGRLQLEVNVNTDVARFRLVNLSSTVTLEWINVTLVVTGQDNPIIQELTGVGQSNTTEFYLPEGDSADPWVALIEAEAASRLANDNQLASRLQIEIDARTASVDAETQGRIAAVAAANSLIAINTAAIAQEILDRLAGDAFGLARANHTGTQLAATISDFNSATRAQVEAELAAGSGITITPSGSGATRVLTLSSSGGGGGGFVFLGKVTAAAAADAQFLSLISSTYDDYELTWSGFLTNTNNTLAGIQFSSNNGSTWVTTGYEYGRKLLGVSTSFEHYVRGSALSVAAIGIEAFSSSVVSSGRTRLFRANTSEIKEIVSEGLCGNGGDGHSYGTVTMSRNTTAMTFNALRVIATAGTITGVLCLYGLAKA